MYPRYNYLKHVQLGILKAPTSDYLSFFSNTFEYVYRNYLMYCHNLGTRKKVKDVMVAAVYGLIPISIEV